MSWIKLHYKNLITILNKKLCELKLLSAKPSSGEKIKAISPEKLQPAIAELSANSGGNYFVEARSWADDMYTQVIISRNRYKLAFFTAMGLAVMLTIAIDGLIPLQHMEPLLINHYQDGRVSVQPIKQALAPTNQALIESEIVNYIMNRESYDPSSYDMQYSLINLLSDNTVAKEYINNQSSLNKNAPINILANHGFRTVHIDSIVYLDSIQKNQGKVESKQTHHNLAQVNFAITDHLKDSATQKTKALTALISWEHRGTPSDPGDMWRDWDGFTVTRYTVEQRNV